MTRNAPITLLAGGMGRQLSRRGAPFLAPADRAGRLARAAALRDRPRSGTA